jgi:hypothetical protein
MPFRENFQSRSGQYTKDFRVFFKKDLGFYIKDLPPDLVKMTNIINRSDTINEIRQQINTAYHQWIEVKKKSKKVIAINLTVSGGFAWRKTSVNSKSRERHRFNKYDGGFGKNIPSGHGFGIDYDILIRWEIDGKYKYSNTYDPGDGEELQCGHPHNLGEGKFLVDYTPERIAFLKQIQDNMEQMIDKIIDFFSADDLGKLMDTGVKLLEYREK